MTSAAVPTSQRAHRAPVARRPVGRVAVIGDHVAWLSPRVTRRDRWLARMLAEHKVLTSTQIAELAFPSEHAARARLVALYRCRVVDRFQPYTSRGAAQYHYVLDTAGATLLAQEDGIDPRELRRWHEDAIAIADSLRLAHTVAANGFFTALVGAARRPGDTRPGARLDAWWPEDRCARHFAEHVRPDGYGRWTEPDSRGGTGELEFFTEIDMGTEVHTRLAGKLVGYAALAAATGITTPVLFAFRTTTREAHARRSLAAALARLDEPDTVPVATAAADYHPPPEHSPTGSVQGVAGPAGPVWLPVHPDRPRGWSEASGRVRLAQLPAQWPQLLPPTPTTPAPPAGLAGSAAVAGIPDSRAAGRPRLAPPPPMPPGTNGATEPGDRAW